MSKSFNFTAKAIRMIERNHSIHSERATDQARFESKTLLSECEQRFSSILCLPADEKFMVKTRDRKCSQREILLKKTVLCILHRKEVDVPLK